MKNQICLNNSPGAQRAFTLLEMAVVLVVLTFLMSMLALPLSAQVQMRRYDDTRKLLETAKEALLGFASANGRLPCPASATSNGQESFASGDASTGNCSNFYDGFLPGATLGLAPLDSQGFVVDAWSTQHNRIRYAVKDSTASHSLTATNGIQLATMSTLSGRNYLYICASGAGVTASTCGSAAKLTDAAPFVLFSTGPNAASGGTGTDEAENLDADAVFVSHDPSPASSGNEFDDIVTWASLNVLFSRMMAAGKLP